MYVQRITLFNGKIHYTLMTGCFIHHSTVLTVKRVELLFFFKLMGPCIVIKC